MYWGVRNLGYFFFYFFLFFVIFFYFFLFFLMFSYFCVFFSILFYLLIFVSIIKAFSLHSGLMFLHSGFMLWHLSPLSASPQGSSSKIGARKMAGNSMSVPCMGCVCASGSVLWSLCFTNLHEVRLALLLYMFHQFLILDSSGFFWDVSGVLGGLRGGDLLVVFVVATTRCAWHCCFKSRLEVWCLKVSSVLGTIVSDFDGNLSSLWVQLAFNQASLCTPCHLWPWSVRLLWLKRVQLAKVWRRSDLTSIGLEIMKSLSDSVSFCLDDFGCIFSCPPGISWPRRIPSASWGRSGTSGTSLCWREWSGFGPVPCF